MQPEKLIDEAEKRPKKTQFCGSLEDKEDEKHNSKWLGGHQNSLRLSGQNKKENVLYVKSLWKEPLETQKETKKHMLITNILCLLNREGFYVSIAIVVSVIYRKTLKSWKLLLLT
jgi:hypothetical protein